MISETFDWRKLRVGDGFPVTSGNLGPQDEFTAGTLDQRTSLYLISRYLIRLADSVARCSNVHRSCPMSDQRSKGRDAASVCAYLCRPARQSVRLYYAIVTEQKNETRKMKSDRFYEAREKLQTTRR